MAYSKGYERGFTLVELLVCISIVVVLIGLIVPAVQFARESSRRMACTSQMRQIAIGLHRHHETFGSFPPGISSRIPKLQSTFFFHLLPFLEHEQVYETGDAEFAKYPYPLEDTRHSTLATPISLFACPSDGIAPGPKPTHHNYQVALTSYLGVLGTDFTKVDGVLYVDSRTTFAIVSDGASNTICIGERPPSPDFWYGWWYAGHGQEYSGSLDMLLGTSEIIRSQSDLVECSSGPYPYVRGTDEMCDTAHFWSRHPSGANFAFVDGSVRFIAYHEGGDVLVKLGTRAMGD